jgi:hypothetical protein
MECKNAVNYIKDMYRINYCQLAFQQIFRLQDVLQDPSSITALHQQAAILACPGNTSQQT